MAEAAEVGSIWKTPSMGIAGVSAGLDVLSGVLGFLSSQSAAGIASSRARMIRTEAEFNAQRYAEQSASFKASQLVGYLKSGVKLSGSPLDVLDETARVAAANIAAIRAGGEARAVDMESEAAGASTRGRLALIGGIFGGAKDIIGAAHQGYLSQIRGTPRNTQDSAEDF